MRTQHRARAPIGVLALAIIGGAGSAAVAQPTTVTVSPPLPPDQVVIEEPAVPTAEDIAGETLLSEMIDPTQPLLSLSTAFQQQVSFHEVPGSATTLRFHGVVPVEAFGYQNVLQAEVWYLIDRPGIESDGLAATRITDWVVLPQEWGRVAFGGVLSLDASGMSVPRGADGRLMDGTDGRFQLGPAGAVTTRYQRWTLGVSGQILIGDGDAITTLQPIVGYALSPTVSLAAGDLQLSYDWGADEFTSIPFGIQVNKVLHMGDQPIRLFAQPSYNAANAKGAPAWTVVLGAALLSWSGT